MPAAKLPPNHKPIPNMAERRGLEPPTSTVTVWRSNQLNYRSKSHFLQFPYQISVTSWISS